MTGMTQVQLAEKLGVSPARVSDYEHDRVAMGRAMAKRAADGQSLRMQYTGSGSRMVIWDYRYAPKAPLHSWTGIARYLPKC
jgi:transcriptional regulator with XRE-family HTH domain